MSKRFKLPEFVRARLAAHMRRTAGDVDTRLRSARALLSPTQLAAVEDDPALARLFLGLDLLGAKDAPEDADAARLALVSRTTLWRRCVAALGCTFFEFKRAWRVAVAALIYRCGKGHVRQDVVAERTGLRTRSRLRAAFLACTGLLPTGVAPRSLARTAWRRSPLFAETG